MGNQLSEMDKKIAALKEKYGDPIGYIECARCGKQFMGDSFKQEKDFDNHECIAEVDGELRNFADLPKKLQDLVESEEIEESTAWKMLNK